MLKLGEKIISDIYLGDKKIAKVFLGEKLVYQANKPIFLDYISFDGNSYIDMAMLSTPTSKWEVDCQSNKAVGEGFQSIFGAQSSTSYNRLSCIIISTNASARFVLSGSAISIADKDINFDTVADANNRHVYGVDVKNCKAYVDEIEIFGNQYNDLSTNVSVYIMARNSAGTASNFAKGKLYGAKHWEDDILKQDLRPCIDPKGVVCMYDMVTKKYFYNQGTGTLKAGNVIKFVDYIHTDGNSYIDTGIALGINHKVYVKVKAPTSSSSAIQLFGNYSDSAGYFTCNIANSAGAISRFDGVSYTGNISRSDGNFHTYTLDKNGILIDSDTLLNWNKTPTDFQQSDSFYLFRARGSSSVAPSGTQISEEKVWENDTLVQHLKPCVVAGEAGFYDMVTGNVFTNAGTGALKASGRFVESIVFDGASWIDTGINKQSCTIECTVKLESTDYRQFLCGWSHIGGYYIAVDTSNRFELGSSAIVTGSNATELSNVVAEHTETEMILTVNGNYAKRTKQVQTEPDKNYWLGNINSTSYSAPIKGQVRGHKFKNADGVLIQDLRPYVDENGTACFKDIVTGKLFYNQGTGKLEYTE